jgi:hypothetical protein
VTLGLRGVLATLTEAPAPGLGTHCPCRKRVWGKACMEVSGIRGPHQGCSYSLPAASGRISASVCGAEKPGAGIRAESGVYCHYGPALSSEEDTN